MHKMLIHVITVKRLKIGLVCIIDLFKHFFEIQIFKYTLWIFTHASFLFSSTVGTKQNNYHRLKLVVMMLPMATPLDISTEFNFGYDLLNFYQIRICRIQIINGQPAYHHRTSVVRHGSISQPHNSQWEEKAQLTRFFYQHDIKTDPFINTKKAAPNLIGAAFQFCSQCVCFTVPRVREDLSGITNLTGLL